MRRLELPSGLPEFIFSNKLKKGGGTGSMGKIPQRMESFPLKGLMPALMCLGQRSGKEVKPHGGMSIITSGMMMCPGVGKTSKVPQR